MAIDAAVILPAIFFTIVAVVIASVLFKKKPEKEAPKKPKYHEETPSHPVESYQSSSEPLEIPALVNHPIFGTTVTAEAKEEVVVKEEKKVEEPVVVAPVVEDVGVVEQPAVAAAVVEAVQVSAPQIGSLHWMSKFTF